MDEFIKSLNQDYELVQYRIKDVDVIFHIQSNKKELACPFCSLKTKKIMQKERTRMHELKEQDLNSSEKILVPTDL